MTTGPSGVLTRKPVPSALSPLISTTAEACSAESFTVGEACWAMAGAGGEEDSVEEPEIRQGQSLVITPQLQQAIKLLQLSNIELTEYCETELEKNPLLERDDSTPAQAERERQARVILGDSERQVAEKFAEAAKSYTHNPVALHLRAMNMLYEGLKQNSTIVIVPSSAIETMQLGGLAGMTALTMGIGQENASKAQAARNGHSAVPAPEEELQPA